jgi:hypothetical protein
VSVDKSVEKSVDSAWKPPLEGTPEELLHTIHNYLTLGGAEKVRSPKELELLPRNPHALLLLIHKYLNTETARPFLLSDEVEEVMARLRGVPDSVRRAAGLIVLLGRFYASDSRSEEDSVPR